MAADSGRAGSDAAESGFTARLKRALVGDPEARFVYVNNFEVERVWGRGEPGLPGAGLSFSASTVNRIEETGLLLADDHDFVLLKEAPDPGYAAYLAGIGAGRAAVLTVDRNDPAKTVTEDALESPHLLETLRALADGRTYLAPLGVSEPEERLAATAGLPLAGPTAAVARAVNGKVFSRELVDAAGLRPVPGAACRTLDELVKALSTHLIPGGRPVVVKESLGVSGRGLVVLDSVERGERLLRMLTRRAAANERVALVAEQWLEKKCDLNYQFLIGRDGRFGFETVKTALTRNGVHRGHLFPPDLDAKQIAYLEESAAAIAASLFRAGYHGLVGVDAILDADGVIYPCLEINARFNMATYQNRISDRLIPPDRTVLATTFELRPSRILAFEEVRAALGALLLDSPERFERAPRGGLVNNFATLNAALRAGGQPYGRLYMILLGEGEQDVLDLREQVENLLGELVVG